MRSESNRRRRKSTLCSMADLVVACSLAEEIRNPTRTVPMAMLTSYLAVSDVLMGCETARSIGGLPDSPRCCSE